MTLQPTDQIVHDITLGSAATVAVAVGLGVDMAPGMTQIAVATVTSEMSEVIVQLVAAAVDPPSDETEIVTAA